MLASYVFKSYIFESFLSYYFCMVIDVKHLLFYCVLGFLRFKHIMRLVEFRIRALRVYFSVLLYSYKFNFATILSSPLVFETL